MARSRWAGNMKHLNHTRVAGRGDPGGEAGDGAAEEGGVGAREERGAVPEEDGGAGRDLPAQGQEEEPGAGAGGRGEAAALVNAGFLKCFN